MLIHYLTGLTDVVLQQGGVPEPPELFGDASGMPGWDKVQSAIYWFGKVVIALCVIGIAWFGARMVMNHRDPHRHSGDLGQSAGMIVLGLTVLGSVSSIVTFFLSD